MCEKKEGSRSLFLFPWNKLPCIEALEHGAEDAPAHRPEDGVPPPDHLAHSRLVVPFHVRPVSLSYHQEKKKRTRFEN